MKLLLIAGLPDFLPDYDYELLLGIDAGALWALEQGLKLDWAIGDFDSVSATDFERISASAKRLERLNPIKDITDFEAALSMALKAYPGAEIRVIGALGGRLDHELTNIYLPTREHFAKFAPQVTLQNKQNLIRYYLAGQHDLKAFPAMKYVGFVKLGADNFSIEQAKYPLKAEDNFADIYASNEFLSMEQAIHIRFTDGMVVVIYSSDTAS